MSAQIKSRIPSKAAKDEIIEIKLQITHDMESGHRKDASGKVLPRRIINKMVCTWNNEVVTSADWYPSMSANPFIVFHARATESGKITIKFHDDNGEVYETSADITVG